GLQPRMAGADALPRITRRRFVRPPQDDADERHALPPAAGSPAAVRFPDPADPEPRKVFVEGSRPDLRVPMRETAPTRTPTLFGGEDNPPVTAYDCTGPYTDPAARIDLSAGLPALRARWIEERG